MQNPQRPFFCFCNIIMYGVGIYKYIWIPLIIYVQYIYIYYNNVVENVMILYYTHGGKPIIPTGAECGLNSIEYEPYAARTSVYVCVCVCV
jgi:hypothetical protein